MPDELKREEEKNDSFMALYERFGMIMARIEFQHRERARMMRRFARSITQDTGEKECEDCGQVKDDVVLCQNPLEDVEEDLMWLCWECHDSRNEEV